MDTPLFGDPLADYQQGGCLDLRFKIAVDLLKEGVCATGHMEGPDGGTDLLARTAHAQVRYAMELAGELVAKSLERGWIKELPDTGELTQRMRHHVDRQARSQLEFQLSGQRAAQQEQPVVSPLRRM